jgi:hypothetical protein
MTDWQSRRIKRRLKEAHIVSLFHKSVTFTDEKVFDAVHSLSALSI